MVTMAVYQQIAEYIRREILGGHLRPGDRLAPMREMSRRWHCTSGTVQRAYQVLAREGLVVSRSGQGTHVVTTIFAEAEAPLRRAALVHRAESFLLEVLTAGYGPSEVEQAVRLAMDRWLALAAEPPSPARHSLRFVGSHDPAVSLIAAHFGEIVPDGHLSVTFTGSLGGLIALAKGEADLGGSHLWDQESDTYNRPFVQRLLPGRKVALLTLAHRRLGLITPPGNPARLARLEDLTTPELRFINRQQGAGTRVWLDAQLHRQGISPTCISGYGEEALTHSEVAAAVAEGRADVGLGVEAAALSYGLGFLPLTTELYELVIPVEVWEGHAARALARWISTPEARAAIGSLGGYDTTATGTLDWIGG